MSTSAQPLDRRAWRQIVIITVAAAGLFVIFRRLPTGTNLSHMDFRATSTNSIEFCDPLNPQFLPVVEVQSPVALTLTPEGATVPGRAAHFILTLKTASGKPIAPEDLLVTHTRLLHLLIVDPWLDDYQHVHPEPGARAGEWTFAFTPKREGTYRVFADFTPVVTARGLYASTDVVIGRSGPTTQPATVLTHGTSWVVERDGFRFALVPVTQPVRARQPVDLKLVITRTAGGTVPLEPVMGAFAHLVAFDQARSGFAHLHPLAVDPLQPLDGEKPVMNFKIMIPAAGWYVIWAQLNLGGRETFVPFWFEVE